MECNHGLFQYRTQNNIMEALMFMLNYVTHHKNMTDFLQEVNHYQMAFSMHFSDIFEGNKVPNHKACCKISLNQNLIHSIK
jgi:Tfp pilus assembly protein PilO